MLIYEIGISGNYEFYQDIRSITLTEVWWVQITDDPDHRYMIITEGMILVSPYTTKTAIFENINGKYERIQDWATVQSQAVWITSDLKYVIVGGSTIL